MSYGDDKILVPTELLFDLTNDAVHVHKTLIGKGSQADVYDFHTEVQAPFCKRDDLLRVVIKQYERPYVDDEEVPTTCDSVMGDGEHQPANESAVMIHNGFVGTADMFANANEEELENAQYSVVRDAFEHEVFVLRRLTQMFHDAAGLERCFWPFPAFLGSLQQINDDTNNLELCIFMERCVGDLQHLDRVLPLETRVELEKLNKWPAGFVMSILTLHVLWALHYWRQQPGTFAMVQADLKPDNVMVRRVSPSKRVVRLPMQWQTRKQKATQHLVLPNIGFFAIVADYGASTLFERPDDQHRWTRHRDMTELMRGILYVSPEDTASGTATNEWEDWGVHPEQVHVDTPNDNSYDLDFFINTMTEIHTEKHENDALASALRACIEPAATFSNEGGSFALGDGSLDFAAHLRLGESLDDRGVLYPLKKRTQDDNIQPGDPIFLSGVDRPITLSGQTPEAVIRSVYGTFLSDRNNEPSRVSVLRQPKEWAKQLDARPKKLHSVDMVQLWTEEVEEEQEQEENTDESSMRE